MEVLGCLFGGDSALFASSAKGRSARGVQAAAAVGADPPRHGRGSRAGLAG